MLVVALIESTIFRHKWHRDVSTFRIVKIKFISIYRARFIYSESILFTINLTINTDWLYRPAIFRMTTRELPALFRESSVERW